jgi:hypothetical protein
MAIIVARRQSMSFVFIRRNLNVSGHLCIMSDGFSVLWKLGRSTVQFNAQEKWYGSVFKEMINERHFWSGFKG